MAEMDPQSGLFTSFPPCTLHCPCPRAMVKKQASQGCGQKPTDSANIRVELLSQRRDRNAEVGQGRCGKSGEWFYLEREIHGEGKEMETHEKNVGKEMLLFVSHLLCPFPFHIRVLVPLWLAPPRSWIPDRGLPLVIV